MGNRSKRRKKRQEAMKQKESHPVLTPGERQERELLLNCQEQRLTLPHQLRQWNRYFLNHASYVAALQGWVTAQSMRKGHIRIEDDVDRGLMRTQPYVPNTNHGAPKTNDNPWVGWSRDESDWDEATGLTNHREDYWAGIASGGSYSPLPFTPHLAKPDGLCGEDHHVI